MLVHAPPAGATFPGTPGGIAYAGSDGHPDWEIYTTKPNGGDKFKVIDNSVDDLYPSWGSR